MSPRQLPASSSPTQCPLAPFLSAWCKFKCQYQHQRTAATRRECHSNTIQPNNYGFFSHYDYCTSIDNTLTSIALLISRSSHGLYNFCGTLTALRRRVSYSAWKSNHVKSIGVYCTIGIYYSLSLPGWQIKTNQREHSPFTVHIPESWWQEEALRSAAGSIPCWTWSPISTMVEVPDSKFG